MSAIYDATKIPPQVKDTIFGRGMPINPINLVPMLPNKFKANYLGPQNDLSEEYIAKHPPLNFADEQALIHDKKYNKSEAMLGIDPNEATMIQRGADIRMVHNLKKHESEKFINRFHPQTILGKYGIQGKMWLEDMMGKQPTHKGKKIDRHHPPIEGYRKGGIIKTARGRRAKTVAVHKGELIYKPKQQR